MITHYNKFVKKVHESVRDKMKPKPKEEIRDIISKRIEGQELKLHVFKEVIGKVLKDVKVEYKDSDEIYFYFEDGSEYKMYHSQDCCEHVELEDVNGDVEDLIGEPLLLAEETSASDTLVGRGDDSATWTFYKFATIKGYVDIRWYGSSNGYYSERAEFRKVKDEEGTEIKPSYHSYDEDDVKNESVQIEDSEIKKYNHMIDYTQLDPAATEDDILELTEKARIIEPASICILPKMVRFGKENLKDTDIMVCTVISFPGGNNPLENKLAETRQAIADGADEIDMVLDYQLLKKNWDGAGVNEETEKYLLSDISQLAKECHKNDITLKVIVESGLLDIPQTVYVTNLCLQCGADFIKTSTGKVAIGAELDKVKAMKNTIAEFGGTMFIKASGGIRTIEDIKKFYPFVDRFGVGWGAVDTMNGLSKETKSNY